MPTLKELSEVLKEDEEIAYVTENSKVAVAEYNVPSENPSSIYTKLNKYPYEFEINSSLQLASVDGIEIVQGNERQRTYEVEKIGEATGTTQINMDATLYDEIYIVLDIWHPEVEEDLHTHYAVKTFTITDKLVTHCIKGAWNYGAAAFACINNKQVRLETTRVGNEDTTSKSKISVWGIKY